MAANIKNSVTGTATPEGIFSFPEPMNSLSSKGPLPTPYDYTNYREYLRDFLAAKKSLNPTYSASSFARKAGLGENSRGYLKLVIDGKRNLTPNTIRAFGEALGLNVQDSVYFENLVLFNQAEKSKDRKYYFDRLISSQPKKKSPQIELLEAQYRYFNHWYVMAIRELVGTETFDENPAAISRALKGRITAQEATEALAALVKLGLISRADDGRYHQTSPLLSIKAGFWSPFIQNYHLGMMEQARHALLEDEYEERNASGVTLSCRREKLPEIKKDIDDFRAMITEKYGICDQPADAVIQVCLQLFQLTETNGTRTPNTSRPE